MKNRQPEMAGYCDLCRAMEMKLYGTIVNEPGERHTRACREAGCGHPADYTAAEAAAAMGPGPKNGK